MITKLYKIEDITTTVNNVDFCLNEDIYDVVRIYCENYGYKIIRNQEYIRIPETLFVLLNNDDIENPKVFEIKITPQEILK